MTAPRRRVADGATAIRPSALADLDALLEKDERDWGTDARLAFAVLDASDGDRLIGGAALSNVVRGSWQNATLGYWIGADVLRRGHATRAVRLVAAYAFELAGPHRVQAAVIPANAASLGVMRRAGLRHEGLARYYLEIAGAWQDHEIFAATVEDGGDIALPSIV